MGTVQITLSVWDAGCLPVTLRTAIEGVERQLRVRGPDMADPDRSAAQQYLGQLQNCLSAVNVARAL